MQRRRRPKAPTACKQLVSGTISLLVQLLFTFLTVLVRYRSHNIFSLTRWFGRFTQNFTCSTLLRIKSIAHQPSYGTITPYGSTFQWILKILIELCPSYNPNHAETRLVWAIPVRSPLLRESLIVFFSSGYLDVSVLRVCPFGDMSSTCRVTPFRNLHLKDYLRLSANIATYHVFHRCCEPRHPPIALITYKD